MNCPDKELFKLISNYRWRLGFSFWYLSIILVLILLLTISISRSKSYIKIRGIEDAEQKNEVHKTYLKETFLNKETFISIGVISTTFMIIGFFLARQFMDCEIIKNQLSNIPEIKYFLNSSFKN